MHKDRSLPASSCTRTGHYMSPPAQGQITTCLLLHKDRPLLVSSCSWTGLGLGTEFRSEKIPRNRLGTVSVIMRKNALIPSSAEEPIWKFGTERNGIPRRKFFFFFFNIFWGDFFYFFLYYIQHCFICRPSDSTVPTDAGIEPRTVATGALTVRHSNH